MSDYNNEEKVEVTAEQQIEKEQLALAKMQLDFLILTK